MASSKRGKLNNNNLLGRKRPVVENIVSEYSTDSNIDIDIEDIEEVEDIMKEIETETTIDHTGVLEACTRLLESEPILLQKDLHVTYLKYAFTSQFPPQLTALDASQPWLLYWIANSFKVINHSEYNLTEDYQRRIVEKLFKNSPKGGPFGGGMGQLPHIAGTYAAINALSLCENIDNSWDMINRKEIYEWLLRLKQTDGGFKTCLQVGENDTRGVYCALSVASMLNILTPELTSGVVDYLVNCQTFEGGFGGCPQEDEAHGGYTFCALASLVILNAVDKIDINALMEWCSARQCSEERGFNGRSNKLVDGCYSFWVGATASMLESLGYGICMNKDALHEYICQCCQSEDIPGLKDKPGKNPDFYHTNYVLLGLSLCESDYTIDRLLDCSPATAIISQANHSSKSKSSNLAAINPVYGLPIEDLNSFVAHFKQDKYTSV